MMIRAITELSSKSVLAVDADPNSCLALTMGVEVAGTVAEIREKSRKSEPNSGTDRMRSFEYSLQQAITEAKGFDLLTMGQPEGPSCYCAANNLLRQFTDKLNLQYGFVVIDNEAGMEHLSRRTTNNIDLLCIVTEATPIGQITAGRIFALARTLPINVKQTGIIWNKSDSTKNLDGIQTLGCVPYDQAVEDISMQGKTINELETDSLAFLAVQQIIKQRLKI
jgi:CO dehydrogenase maturation factor